MISRVKRLTKKALREMSYFTPLPTEARYFVVVCQERTGSTLLSDLLSFHPQILMDIHYFYTADTWPEDYTDGHRVFSRKPVRGYKFKVTHTPRQTPIEAAKAQISALSERISIIRLTRRNKLRQALSAINHNTPQHIWKDEGHGAEKTGGPAAINVEKFLESVEYYDRLTTFEDKVLADIPHHEVVYERDLLPQDRHQSTATAAFEYLGLPPAPVETRLKKTSTSNLRNDIGNFDEVYEAIKDTKYLQFVEDAKQVN